MRRTLSLMQANKRIAMIAHDNMKDALFDWAIKHKEKLVGHKIYATGTTGFKLEKKTGLRVEKCISGPLGGDQQIGALIAEREIDVMFFFWDPFEPMPHDPDVKALLRIAAAWNIPVACNAASADFIIQSSCFDSEYERSIPDYDQYLKERDV